MYVYVFAMKWYLKAFLKTTITEKVKNDLSKSRCKDFVVFCDVQNQFFDNDGNWGQPCCDVFFNAHNPVFTSYGVCYVTKERLTERFPFQFSAFEVWTMVDNLSTPGKNISNTVKARFSEKIGHPTFVR